MEYMHCNPLHLQMEIPPRKQKENKDKYLAYMKVMEVCSDYFRYKGERITEEIVKRYMREYAEVCARDNIGR